MATRLVEVSGLIKALAWPLVALLAIGLFYRPIQTTLDTISNRSDDIEDIKLGGIELKIRASDLPKSSPAVASSIVGLSEREIVILLEIQPGGYGYCKGKFDSQFEVNAQKPLDDLRTRNLIQIEERTRANDESCGYELFAHLSDQGKSARSFIVDLVSAQLKSANSTPGT
ncbi:MAG TPA: hypothetical protein VNH44_01325 [Micropepsaceae bacterium]|nr:hypothetical protein [Micropepsaceae bacterium]